MEFADDLASERRSRLAAERLLDQMKSELSEANRRLANHARSLSTEIVSSREEMGRVKTEAETLKSEVTHVREDLERAESAMVIAERRLWDSLETIRDGFAVFGPDNVLIAANRSYLSLFDGLEMVRPGIDLATLFELFADEGIVDTGELRSRVWQYQMLGRLDSERIEHAVLKLWNGQYVQLIDRRTRDGDLVTLALNITEQTIREDQLREARVRAEAANRAKSAFLANMSHEIRTPMNGVVAMAEMLAETQLDEEQRAYAETIRSSGEALLVIINDVLDYSKIEADKVSFESQPFDLERCIHDVVTLLRPGAQDKSLQIAVDYDLFMPTSYVGDAGRIRQVLTNLIGNAIKFTEEGHILIRVVGLPGEHGLEYRVHVTVEDTGIGIPEDKLDSIFQEFQQVENEQDRTHDGTGLGLAITQRLVKAMDGDVWVDSREGAGSGFGFFLPLEAVEDVEPEDITAPSWMDRAIVLDDDGMNRTVLLKQLGLIGLKTSTVDRVDEIAAARPSGRDIVFLGHGVADGDAFEAARALREQFMPAGIFLLVSGPTKVPAGGMAFDQLLQRPVLRAAMMDCLNALAAPELAEVAPEPMVDEAALPELTEPVEADADSKPIDTANLEEGAAIECDAPEALEQTAQGAGGLPNESNTSQPPNIRLPVALPEGRRRMRVLAAEDNRTNRFVFEKMLKDLDIDLIFAINGLEAIEMFADARPDILFTDISMPKMDGKEATRRIRAMEVAADMGPCPIIAITAHAMDGDADDILEAGVDHYLTKPLKIQQLIDHIVNAQPLDALPALPLPDDEEETDASVDTAQMRATAAE